MTHPTDDELEAMAVGLEAMTRPSMLDTLKFCPHEAAAMLRACKGWVRVKALVWFAKLEQNDCGHTWMTLSAETPFGLMRVNDHRPFVPESGFSFGIGEYYVDPTRPMYPTQEAAQSAAQADYEARILAALEFDK